jgi:hypothetical protein
MSEIKIINDIDTYQNVYPTVFNSIDTSAISVTPFQTHKKWTDVSGSLQHLQPSLAVYTNELNLQGIPYYSINNLFYKNTNLPLFQTSSIFSIPQTKFGESVKPESFEMTGSYHLKSNSNNDIYDVNFNQDAIVDGVIWYEGFNTYFNRLNINYNQLNVEYIPGIITSTGAGLPIGLASYFSGNGFINTEISGEYSRDTNYAISFFVSASNNSTDNMLILAKSNTKESPVYPFRVELNTNNEIEFKVAGSTELIVAVSSTSSISDWTHVICQKSGSELQLYCNGILHGTTSNSILINTFSPLTESARIDNTEKLYIGGFENTMQLTGAVDEIRIFDKHLTFSEITYLNDRTEGGTCLQTSKVGDVFNKSGFAIITSADYRYNDILNTPYTASFRSTLTSYELGVIVTVKAGNLNLSLNPTLTRDNDITYQSFVTGSNFSPYITTIGLYNTEGQLLAIGKLAQPIKKRNDVDMSFLIRIDLDRSLT